MDSKLRAMVPWWAKIAAKLVLSRLPVSGRTWQRLGLFSPGSMLDAKYAIAVFDGHFQAAGRPAPGFTFLELGPGDSLASAVIGHVYGAGRGWLIDSGAYASRDMAVYGRLIADLRDLETRVSLPPDPVAEDLDGLLARCQVEFLQDGLRSFRRVPDQSCDMLFSEAVLEHIPKADFADILGETYRVLRPGGTATHKIDFKDHLGGGLNHIRFSTSVWEAPWFAARSGFYTNRLRWSQMLAAFREAGFGMHILYTRSWCRLPLPRPAMHQDFRYLEDDDLLIREAFVRLVKP